MLFYHMAHHDGLEKLEMDPLYLIQHFQDRLDLLYYRKVDYHPGGQGQVGGSKRKVEVRTGRGKYAHVKFVLWPEGFGKRKPGGFKGL
jgi:hypothetical protein